MIDEEELTWAMKVGKGNKLRRAFQEEKEACAKAWSEGRWGDMIFFKQRKKASGPEVPSRLVGMPRNHVLQTTCGFFKKQRRLRKSSVTDCGKVDFPHRNRLILFFIFSLKNFYWNIVDNYNVLVSGVEQNELVIHKQLSTLF